ncbi:hypothetical protein ACFV1L_31760 [Kitasatospora sp. NPDC059646]|uniref:hypothetical protein n=1 Tax=Kitasatospora sp. NPDC059646 TaxID=3346893 RepID=UPI0036AEE6F5
MEQKLALVSEARRAVLRMDETERPRLVLLAVGGSVVRLMAALGPLLGPMLLQAYYLVVTDRSVYVMSGPRNAGGPRKLLHVAPLAEAAGLVAKVEHGTGWNSLWLRLPGRRRPLRTKVSFQSRAELDRFLAKF